MDELLTFLHRVLDLSRTAEYLGQPWVLTALAAAAVLGVITGLVSPFVVMRRMSFAVHGSAELGFTGAAAALLLNTDVRLGAIVGGVLAAATFGVLAARRRERDSAIGVVLAFGMGLGILMLSLHQGRSANKMGLLVGSIVTVDQNQLSLVSGCGLVVVAGLAALYRPLIFSSADPEVAEARGVPTLLVNAVFALIVGLTTALAVPAVGAVLVLALTVTPGAAAAAVAASPHRAVLASVLIAVACSVAGVLLSLGPGLPPSGYVAVLTFACYLGCRLLGRARARAA